MNDDEVYCFDYISFFDRFYRQIQRVLRERDPHCVEEINRVQSETVENITASLLSQIVRGCTIYRNAYYRSQGEWAECDAILRYKDTLIVIEVRGGSLTPTSPQEDLPSYFRSIESLIVKPANQAWRLLDALTRGPLELFSSNKSDRNHLAALQSSELRFIIPMAVSLDNLHMLGAYFANTTAAINDDAVRPTWVLSLDDLRCFEKIFESPGVFLHYAKKRMMAAAEIDVEAHDEMDHLGLYFRENDYIQQTKDFSGRVARFGYTSDIDKYFFSLGADEAATPPSQELSDQIRQLTEAGDRCLCPLSRALVARVLDGDDESRNDLSQWLEHQRLNPPSPGRFRLCVFSFEDEMLALIFSNDWIDSSKRRALDEAKARLLKAVRINQVLVGYLGLRNNYLELVDCAEVLKGDLTDIEKARLKPISEEQLQRDFSHVKGKIGRNDPCPCASGLKYKKCCLRKRL